MYCFPKTAALLAVAAAAGRTVAAEIPADSIIFNINAVTALIQQANSVIGLIPILGSVINGQQLLSDISDIDQHIKFTISASSNNKRSGIRRVACLYKEGVNGCLHELEHAGENLVGQIIGDGKRSASAYPERIDEEDIKVRSEDPHIGPRLSVEVPADEKRSAVGGPAAHAGEARRRRTAGYTGKEQERMCGGLIDAFTAQKNMLVELLGYRKLLLLVDETESIGPALQSVESDFDTLTSTVTIMAPTCADRVTASKIAMDQSIRAVIRDFTVTISR